MTTRLATLGKRRYAWHVLDSRSQLQGFEFSSCNLQFIRIERLLHPFYLWQIDLMSLATAQLGTSVIVTPKPTGESWLCPTSA